MTTTYGYDANGNQTSVVDNLGHTTAYYFDALNRMTNTTFQDGTKQVTAYDADGRKIAQTDQALNTTLFGYDGLGRLISVTNALNQATRYAYDEVGNQTNQVDALLRTNSYAYDALGRRVQHVLPGGQSERFGYDSVGKLLAHTNFNGLVITNQYDLMNRLTARGTNGVSLEQYVYDNAGELTSRTDLSGNYSWVYDLRGRVATNGTPVGTLYYQYDSNGNQTNLTSATSGGVSVLYQYDALNRITNVVDNGLTGTKNTAYGFDGVGNLQSLKYPNGVTNLWQYDQLNRLTNIVWKNGSSPLASFNYQLGPTGNRTSLNESLNGSSRTFAWGYDNLYRLTNETISVTAPTGTIGYAFDAVGNRTNRASTVSGINGQTPTFGTNDWLSTDSYDSDGNTTSSSSVAYQYDYADRLTNAGGGSVTISYDADGNRIKKVASSTTLYLVATVNPTGYPQVVEEKSVSGSTTNLSKVYTYGLSLISQRAPGTSTNFFGMDGHGSTRFLADVGGNVANTFVYDAYGTLIAFNSTPQTAYLYCGEQFDPDLGMYYLRARYYAPGTGRFWTMDTDEGHQDDPLSLHKYLYCRANPGNAVDPSGHDLVDLLVSTSIGASLDAMYNQSVVNIGNAAIATIIGVQRGYSQNQILAGYLGGIGIGVGGGYVLGRTASFFSDLIYGAEVAPEIGVAVRLNGILDDYWELSGGVTVQEAEQLVQSEGFGFEIGSVTRGSRFDPGRNTVFISPADLRTGQVNRLMLAEEIQHGLDGVTAEASKSIYRGLSNEQFHAEVFQRVLDNYEQGKFSFLNAEDLAVLKKVIQALQ